ncbi:serpin I2 [Fopius arisanus]|uniref:SERPINI2_1 protein n=1 Tax=Fopius arisanus TaxID=64838 RepID=A0A0C9S022_9HYME|nr:PREDICTED: serpin I2-like [Fopius arisanus]
MKAVFLALAFLALHDTRTAGQYQQIEHGMNQFAVDLFQQALKHEPENFVISPLGAYMGLAAVLYGASNVTERELRCFLRLRGIDLFTNQMNFESILDSVDVRGDVSLFITKNQFFIKPSVSVRSTFENILERTFKSSVQHVDFTDTITTAKTINSWSNRSTYTFVDKILNPDALDERTAVLLVNAVHFYGEWATSFASMGTQRGKFYIDEYTPKIVTMMFRNHLTDYGYLPRLNATFVVLPCKHSGSDRDAAINVYFILPETSKDLQHVEDNIYSLTLDDLKKTEQNFIELRMPKFKIDNTVHMGNYFHRLKAFSRGGRYHGMIDIDGPVKIGDLIQRTSFSVDEKGTWGTVAPNYRALVGARLRTEPFLFNRPFFFVVATKDLILLTGKVMEPSV